MDTSLHIGIQPKSTLTLQVAEGESLEGTERFGYIQGPVKKNKDEQEDSSINTLPPMEINLEIYIDRWKNGLDLWTGNPLTGDGLRDWRSQKKSIKRFSNRDNTKRRRVTLAIKKVGVVHTKVKSDCEEHYQFSPSNNLISEIVTEMEVYPVV